MLILKRWSSLTVTAAIAAAFALAFPHLGLTSAEASLADFSSSPASASVESVRDVAVGDPTASGGAAEVVCADQTGAECTGDDIEWAVKKIIRKCGNAGGTAAIKCTETSVEIVGEIKCNPQMH